MLTGGKTTEFYKVTNEILEQVIQLFTQTVNGKDCIIAVHFKEQTLGLIPRVNLFMKILKPIWQN